MSCFLCLYINTWPYYSKRVQFPVKKANLITSTVHVKGDILYIFICTNIVFSKLYSIYYPFSSSSGPPCILDESLESKRHQERQKVISGYKEWRKEVKAVRELDSETRDDLKTKQITLAEKWQVL